jgi:hypothetical protein
MLRLPRPAILADRAKGAFLKSISWLGADFRGRFQPRSQSESHHARPDSMSSPHTDYDLSYSPMTYHSVNSR